MKTKFRKIAALALSLVLICALAAVAFAVNVPFEDKYYDYDNIRMTHTIYGYADHAVAWIEFQTWNGTAIPSDFAFSYNGRVSYNYCPEDRVRPDACTPGGLNASNYVTRSYASISTNFIPDGNIMYDATMRFSVTFRTEHATVSHNNPDSITVQIA